MTRVGQVLKNTNFGRCIFIDYRSGLGRGTKRSRCDTDSLDDKSGSNWDASASSSSTCSMTREKTARRSTRAGQVRQVKSDDGRDHRPEPDVGSPSLLQRFIEAVDERQITGFLCFFAFN